MRAPGTESEAKDLRQRCAELERQLAETRQELAQVAPLARLGRQAAEAAHALRGPVAGLEGFAAVLLGDLSPADPRRRLARRIRDSARVLRQRADNVLALGQPRPARTQAVRVRELLEDGLALVQAERRQRGWAPLEVRRTYATPPPPVAGDPERLGQALFNVLLNASQAMGERGALTLTLRREPAGPRPVMLVVADDGPGIPPAERPRVFEPFFTTRNGGTGLGLPAARRIVEGHGGRIELESLPGHGTTARIALPGPETADSPSSLPEGPGGNGAGRRA
jgi:signal transduction histidine kinase